MAEYTFQASSFGSTISDRHVQKQEKLISWLPPPQNWIKINTNGARCESSDITCARVLGKDSNGQWLGGQLRNIRVCSILQAKFWGALDGLKLAWNLGSHHVILKLDNTLAVQILNKVLNNDVISVNANSNLILAIKIWLIKDWIVKIQLVYRANQAFDQPAGLYSLQYPLMGILNILREDIIEVS